MAATNYTPKSVGGQLAATAAALYTPATSKAGIVKNITLVNTDTAARTVNLYLNIGGTRRRICPQNLSIAAGGMWTDDSVHVVTEPDSVDGDASVANVVDWSISVAEQQ